jgi:SAM-dependent methyltransferase
MSVAKLIAAQLRKPSGLFGQFVVVRLLNLFNTPMNRLALEVLRLQPEDRVLEVGFGGGDLIARMARILTRGHIGGVDFSSVAVETCTKRFASLIKAGRIDLHCANLDALPFDEGTFTKVVTSNTIYFWPNPSTALGEMHRVLEKDGTLVVCFEPRAVLGKSSISRHGFTLFDPEEVSTLLSAAGLREVQLFYGKHHLGECVAAEGRK